MNTQDILKDRRSEHGDYKLRANMTIDLQNIVDKYRLQYDEDIPPYQLEALRMICVKIARIINGDNNMQDHWVDIAGYATLICEQLTEDSRNTNSPKGI